MRMICLAFAARIREVRIPTPFKEKHLKRITHLVDFSISGRLMLNWVSKAPDGRV
jgi:hypothetical protein